MKPTRTLVLGIGNSLLTDEGAGIHVIDHLNKWHSGREDIIYMDGGTLSFSLATDVEDADQLVVVDAAELKSPPGTVKWFENDDMDRFLGGTRRSVHEVGLVDLLDIARLTELLPARRALVGIQPQSTDWGLEPTEAVREAIPRAARAVLALIQRWEQADPDYNVAKRRA